MTEAQLHTSKQARAIGHIGHIGLIGLMAVLASCSADHSEEPRATLTMQLQPSVAGYEEVVRQPTTRSWTPPTGFYPYSSMASWFPSQENITNRNIGIFLK